MTALRLKYMYPRPTPEQEIEIIRRLAQGDPIVETVGRNPGRYRATVALYGNDGITMSAESGNRKAAVTSLRVKLRDFVELAPLV